MAGSEMMLVRPVMSVLEFSDDQRRMIRDTFASGANDAEFDVLMEIARARNLNPLFRQIHFVSRWDAEKHRPVWQAQVAIDGLRAIAERSGLYAGQDEPEFAENPDGSIKLCKVRVYRSDWPKERPAVGIAYWAEYVQTIRDKATGKTRPSAMWAKMPHVMIAKVAEALALRKAFPEGAAGLLSVEEMGQSQNDAPDPVEPQPRDEQRRHVASAVVTNTRPVDRQEQPRQPIPAARTLEQPVAEPQLGAPSAPTGQPSEQPVVPAVDANAAATTLSPSLDEYRARCEACTTLDELVAVRLANRHRSLSDDDQRSAKESTGKVARRFAPIEEFGAAVATAEAITKEPAVWRIVEQVMGDIARSTTPADLKGVLAKHAPSFRQLPELLKKKLNALWHARNTSLPTTPSEAAVALEGELHAAFDGSALDAVASKIVEAAKSGKITVDEATRLSQKQNELATVLKRSSGEPDETWEVP